jgi:hypothetical protein
MNDAATWKSGACSDVEERRFQRRVKALESVRALAPVVAFRVREEFFPQSFSAVENMVLLTTDH